MSAEQRVVGMIPARMAAVRLPGKPLLDLCGKSMVQRVWERACQASLLHDVYVATPDREILEAVERFGGKAIMTSDKHRSGTDRLAEAVLQVEADIVVNIQGDEPLIDPEDINKAVVPLLVDPALQMTSLMAPCPSDQLDNPATVKVVCDRQGNALYFSRARIPFPRASEPAAGVMQHVGLYAYRKAFLLRYAALNPTPLERTEMLEQLRVLENGFTIRMVEVANAPLSVDTPEDLAEMRERIARLEQA